jgi:hypothetical protein
LRRSIQRDHPEVVAPLLLTLQRGRCEGSVRTVDQSPGRAVIADLRVEQQAKALRDASARKGLSSVSSGQGGE